MTDEVELDKTHLIPYLRLLKNRGLIGKNNLGEDRIFYVVTERGLKVLKVIDPIIREAHKIQMRSFEEISSALSAANFDTEEEKRPKRKWKLSDFIKIEVRTP
jgi:hypothetical protein